MKATVIICDGIVESVLADDEAILAGLELTVINHDSDVDDDTNIDNAYTSLREIDYETLH